MTSRSEPLGYKSALRAVEGGRAKFFGGADVDVPVSHSAEIAFDDLTPQFGYVGTDYQLSRVLILGINPGNGPRSRRDAGDAISLPAFRQFAADLSPQSFQRAQSAYRQVCHGWPIWRRHCVPLLEAGRLSADDVAYSSCLPWRTRSEAAFARPIAERAVQLYTRPLIEELQPRVLIALGKRVADVLTIGGFDFPDLVVWNRARAPNRSVVEERTQALQMLRDLLRVGVAT